jgi:hypothetical protein
MFLGRKRTFSTRREVKSRDEVEEKKGKIMIRIISNSIDIPSIFPASCRLWIRFSQIYVFKGWKYWINMIEI